MNRVRSGWMIAFAIATAVLSGIATVATPPSLAGTWVMLQVYPRIALVPMVGVSTQTSYVVQWIELEQDDRSLLLTHRYCFTSIEESSPLSTTEIPDAFMQSLLPEPRAAVLEDRDGTYSFKQDPHLEIRGAILAEPETEDLPVDSEDPRVVDQDEDGFPGLSVNINLLGVMQEQIYVVQRFRYDLEGQVISPDRIEGLIHWEDEQNILEATNPMLLAGSESQPDPDPNKHTFVMIRAQEDWSCDWLRENWNDVFGVEKQE